MRRRDFLLAAPLAAAAPAELPWRFAYSFKGFPGWPLERAYALCSALGYSGVELHAPTPVQAAEARALSASHRLPVVSIMEDLRLTGDPAPQIDRLTAALDLASGLGGPIVETVVGGKPEEWPVLRPQFLERLSVWASLATKRKTVVAIKAHIGSALHLPGDAAALCRKIGSPYLRLNYDYSHFSLQSLPLAGSLDEALPWIAMIHIKDVQGPAGKHRFALPGEGSIDYAAYAELLRNRKYRGPIVVEVSTHVLTRPGFDPESCARFVARETLPKFIHAPKPARGKPRQSQ